MVFISIPYPSPDQTAWGDANGDGVVDTQDSFGAGVDTTTALNNRVAAVRWYVDQAVSRFNSGGYSNLRLGGFNWLPESIPFNRGPNELAVISGAAGVVHGYAGLTFEWIPFFHSEGFRHWSAAGFDVALMQPSYMFSTAPPARIGNSAAISKRYGMGVEMELEAGVLTDAVKRAKYYEYLNGGVTYGYMAGSYLACYEGVKVLHDASLLQA